MILFLCSYEEDDSPAVGVAANVFYNREMGLSCVQAYGKMLSAQGSFASKPHGHP